MYAIFFHAHQTLDKVAYRHLKIVLPADVEFPTIKQILHFEGNKGPDGPKLKRQDNGKQPWHFVNPFDAEDTDIDAEILYHYEGLIDALKKDDQTKASFQAAWLAHALIDGLTPAHHYPYEAELAALRDDEDRDSRKGLIGRVTVKGNTMRESLLKSDKLVGPKGLLTNHAMFEAGAYAIIAPLAINNGKPTEEDIARVKKIGVLEEFRNTAREIAEKGMYHRFIAGGWTLDLNKTVRRELAPRMVRMITLAWYDAAISAQKSKK